MTSDRPPVDPLNRQDGRLNPPILEDEPGWNPQTMGNRRGEPRTLGPGRPRGGPAHPTPFTHEMTLAPPRPAGGPAHPTPASFQIPGYRQRVQAAVAFHLGGKLPGIEWAKAVDPITDRFMEMTGENPQLVSMLEADVNTLYALTDADLAQRIARGEPIGAFGDVFDAIAEVSWEVGATDLAARFTAEAADAMSGRFSALTSTEAVELALEGVGPVLPGARFSPDMAKGAAFQTLFDVPGAWSYAPTARTLAVTVGEQTIGVETRPGFDPENHLDVMAEVVSAQADGRIKGGALVGGQKPGAVERILGVAHEIGQWLDANPGVRQNVDELWDVLTRTSLFSLLEGARGRETGQPLARASDRIRDEKGQISAESIRLASMLPYPDEAITAGIARVLAGETPGLSSKTALTLAAETVAENREQFVADYQTLTAPEILEELEADVEGRSSLGEAIETGMGSVLTVMDAWQGFSELIAVQVGIALGEVSAEDAGFVEADDWGEGFGLFKAMFDVAERFVDDPAGFAGTAAGYFGYEGGAADAVNLAAGLAFDPLNLVFPGAKGLRAIARKGLTDPKFADLYLSMGQFPHIAKTIAEGGRATKTTLPLLDLGDEAVAAAAGRTVTGETAANNKGVLNVLGMSGFSNARVDELLNLALDPDATVDQVNATWKLALGEDWLGSEPMRAMQRDTTLGLGRWVDSIAGGKISDEHLDTFIKWFTKANVRRTFRLGENHSADDFHDLLVELFPADSTRMANYALGASAARQAAGDPVAMAGASAAVKEQARRAMFESGGTIKAVEGGDNITVMNQQLREVEDALSQLHTQGLDESTEAALRTELNQMHSVMARRVDEARPKIVKAQEKKRLGHTQVAKATRLEADQAANSSRNVMGEQAYRLYEDVATDLNKQFGREVVPIVKGRVNPFAPDVPVRNWSEVSGVRGRPPTDADLSLMMGLSADDPELARLADAVGMGARSQHVLLPASPYEVILFQKLGHDTGVFQKVTQGLRNEQVKKVGKVMKAMFAFNLLVNVLTATRVTLDETARFLVKTGDVGQTLRASAAGIPGLGRGSEASVEPIRQGVAAVRRMLKMPMPSGGEAVVAPWAGQYKRGVTGWSNDDWADYGWVDRPARRPRLGEMSRGDYRQQVERWVNGTLLQNPPFRHYARWIDAAETLEDGTKIPPSGFVDWWEHGADARRPGKADANPVKVEVRDQVILGSELTAADAFNITDRIFENWLDLLVEPSQQALMRKTLLAAARGERGGLSLTKDQQLLNAVLKVPGLSGQTGLGSQIFNIFFGAPAGRRAGVFFEQFFKDDFDTLMARHGDRVLTAEKLMDFAKVDKPTADFWLKQGSENQTVGQLIRETGYRTEGP